MIAYIDIKEHSKVPKYQQIVDSVVDAIARGKVQTGAKLPSVNALLIAFDISRDTVVHAYDLLKKKGIIDSVPGKGYYVKNDQLTLKAKVFLLFNKLSAHKKIIYDAFAAGLDGKATLDFFIYENNYRHFKELIRQARNRDYTHFVIICHFEEGGEDVCEFLQAEIPGDKLIVLDKRLPEACRPTATVYQDFERNIYDALVELNPRLRNYQHIRMLFRNKTYHPGEIKKGFMRFCGEYAYDFSVIEKIEAEPLEAGSVYINLKEDDLVTLIKKIKASGLKLGRDVGIISYNDTPLKEVLLDGITVISTDFANLGARAAALVLGQGDPVQENPFYVIERNSL